MGTDQADARDDLDILGRSLEGTRYGFLSDEDLEIRSKGDEVLAWLKAAMRT